MFQAWAQPSSKIVIKYSVLGIHIMNKVGLEKNKIRGHLTGLGKPKRGNTRTKTSSQNISKPKIILHF